MNAFRTAPRRAVSSSTASTAIAALLVAATPAIAFQPLITDDTGTQGAGGNQLEASFSRVKVTGGDVSKAMPFVYTRGITDTLDVFVEKARVKEEPASAPGEGGWSNTIIGGKWRFFENEGGTSLALKPSVAFPVNAADEARGLGSGKTSFEASLIVTQELGWGALHGNLSRGSEKFRDPAADVDYWTLSAAPVVNLDEQWKVALDLGAGREEDTVGVATKLRFAEIGAIFAPNDDLEFALGVIRTRATNDVATAYATEATAGVTWRFK